MAILNKYLNPELSDHFTCSILYKRRVSYKDTTPNHLVDANNYHMARVTSCITFNNFFDLIELSLTHSWLHSYCPQWRKDDNLKWTDVIVFDVDEHISVQQAKSAVDKYELQCFIISTSNHRILKNGKINDRFRIVFPLRERIYHPDDYRYTSKRLCAILFGEESVAKIDPQSFIMLGRWKAGKELLYKREGKQLKRLLAPQKPKPQIRQVKLSKGELSQKAQRFLSGEYNTWHFEFLSVCSELKRRCYSIDEARTLFNAHKIELDDSHDEPQLRWVYTQSDK